MAGRAGRHVDAARLERVQQRLGGHAGKRQRHDVRGAGRAAAVQLGAGGGDHRRHEAIAQVRHPRRVGVEVRDRPRHGQAERRRFPGTFSVPGRRPRSCPPPTHSGASVTPLRSHSAPAPLGPWILCAESASDVDAERPASTGILPERLHRVDVDVAARRAAARASRAASIDRLDGADLVLHPA